MTESQVQQKRIRFVGCRFAGCDGHSGLSRSSIYLRIQESRFYTAVGYGLSDGLKRKFFGGPMIEFAEARTTPSRTLAKAA